MNRPPQYRCPPFQLENRLCECIDCPKREEGCAIEKKTASVGDCRQWFIVQCTLKKALKGEYDAKEESESTSGSNPDRAGDTRAVISSLTEIFQGGGR